MVPTPASATSGAALIPSLTLVVSPLAGGKIPLDAVAVALNVTVTEPMGPGYVTVYPCGDRPGVSNLNYVGGQTVPNFVIAALDDDGDVCIDTYATTDVIVDIAGYVPAGSPLTLLEQPRRFLDTRDGTGAPLRRVRGGETLEVRVAGSPWVPATASAVVFNTTAVAASAPGYVTVFPCGRPMPETSTLNVTAGSTVPNLVTTAVGVDGKVCIYSTVETDLLGDVAAYLPSGSSGVTLFDAPKRVVDTRVGIGGPAAPLSPGVQREAMSLTGVPSNATAVIANLTATEATAAGWMSAFPCGPVPPVSNVNYSAGQSIANHAYVPIVNGRFCLVSNQQTHAVVDIAGYVTGAAAFVPMTPDRLYDSRNEAKVKCNLGVAYASAGLEIVNLSTGTREARLPTATGGIRHAWISPDCSVISVSSPSNAALHTKNVTWYDRSGRALGSLDTDDELFVTDAGIVGYEKPSGEVYDAETNETLFVLPQRVKWAELSGVSEDGGTFLFGSPGQPWTALTADGSDLGLVIPNEYGTFERPLLSPSGVYVAYQTKSGCADAGPATCRPGRWIPATWVVATIGGVVIDRFPVSTDTYLLNRPAWVSDGSLMLTRGQMYRPNATTFISKVEAVRWELFNPPTVQWWTFSFEQLYTMWAGR